MELSSFLTSTAQKTKFPIKDFFSKCDRILWKLQETADLITFTEETVNAKRHFLCSALSLFNVRMYFICWHRIQHNHGDDLYSVLHLGGSRLLRLYPNSTSWHLGEIDFTLRDFLFLAYSGLPQWFYLMLSLIFFTK